MSRRPPIELIVEEQPDSFCYRVCWCDGEPVDNTFLANIPEVLLDIIPYMVARKLLVHGSHPERIVKLRGADFELMRALLGIVAATPVLNDKPVMESSRISRSLGETTNDGDDFRKRY